MSTTVTVTSEDAPELAAALQHHLDQQDQDLFDEHPDARGDAGRRPRQLSFFVGGATPDVSIIQASGKLGCRRELEKGAEVKVQIIDAAGEVVAEEDALVVAVSFTDKRDEDNNVVQTIRGHSAKI